MEVQVIGSPGLDSHLDFPGSSDGEECTCNAGDLGSFPGLGRSLGGGHGNPLQYSCLKYPHGQRSLAGYWELFSLQLLDGCVPVLYSLTLIILNYYSATEGPYASLWRFFLV